MRHEMVLCYSTKENQIFAIYYIYVHNILPLINNVYVRYVYECYRERVRKKREVLSDDDMSHALPECIKL
jgi:uncharacterized protein (DUF4213/DUF364 family)